MMTKILRADHNGVNLIAVVELISGDTIGMTGEPLIKTQKTYTLPPETTMDDLLVEIAKDSDKLDAETKSFSVIKESEGKHFPAKEIEEAKVRVQVKIDKEAADVLNPPDKETLPIDVKPIKVVK